MIRWPRPLIAVACAGSAGVHAALVPSHLREGNAPLAAALAVVAVGLAVVAVAVSSPAHDGWAPPAAVVLLGAIAVAYALSRTSGLPGLVVDPEAVDLAGVLTTVTEALGAFAGVALFTKIRRQSR
jgi:peptidoglycan/LPS O-acetylase OafA/YrhL